MSNLEDIALAQKLMPEYHLTSDVHAVREFQGGLLLLRRVPRKDRYYTYSEDDYRLERVFLQAASTPQEDPVDVKTLLVLTMPRNGGSTPSKDYLKELAEKFLQGFAQWLEPTPLDVVDGISKLKGHYWYATSSQAGPTVELQDLKNFEGKEVIPEVYALLCLFCTVTQGYRSRKVNSKDAALMERLLKEKPHPLTTEDFRNFLAFDYNGAGLSAAPYASVLKDSIAKNLTPKAEALVKALATVVAQEGSGTEPSFSLETPLKDIIPDPTIKLKSLDQSRPPAVEEGLARLAKDRGLDLPLHNGVFLKFLESCTVEDLHVLLKDEKLTSTLSGAMAVEVAKDALRASKQDEVVLLPQEELARAVTAVMRTYGALKLQQQYSPSWTQARTLRTLTEALSSYVEQPLILRLISSYYEHNSITSLDDFMTLVNRLGNRGQNKWVQGNKKAPEIVLSKLLERFTLDQAVDLITKAALVPHQTMSLIDWTNLVNTWDEDYASMPADFWIALVKGDKKILKKTAPEEA